MKKTYSKPEIVFESFAMNVNIAACGFDTNLQARGTCGYPYGGYVMFLDGISDCTGENGWVVKADGENGICYHNPTDTNRLFAS